MKYLLLPLLLTIGTVSSFAQMSATFTQTINTKCNGSDCNYTGPSILINEIMMSPTTNDGCLSGVGGTGDCKGEWIELYNPDLCQPIDISCYYLGSTTTGPLSNDKEGFLIPQGTIVPAGGFCLIRGENASPVPANSLVQNGGNVVEIIMSGTINTDGMCVVGGTFSTPTRFWFPNSGGWFAFYDRNGNPQDAVSWGSGTVTPGQPCVPTRTGCNNTITTLSDYASIPNNRKTQLYTTAVPDSWGQSIRRSPDGGAWIVGSGTPTPTPGNCNATCATAGSSSCDGTATINVTGGATPYTYVWNDSEGQLTQTAVGLCAGTYQVKVKDNNNVEQTFSVTIVDHVPTVTFDPLQDICNKGQVVPLTVSPSAGAGQTGVFTGSGIAGGSFNAATAGDGTFPLTYTFTDENGCKNSANSSITVHPQPVAAMSGIDANYCLSNQTITPTLSPAGGTLSGPGVTNNTFSILDAGVGTHTLKYVVTTQYGCADSVQTTVTVTGSTPPTFTIQDDICLNADPISLTGTPAGGVFTTGGQTITEFNPIVHGLGNHIIAYTIEDPINPACMAQAIDSIMVIDGPTVSSNILDYYCFGDDDFPVVMTPAGGQLTGTLLTGDNLIISTAAAGDYSVSYEYTTPEGCHSSYTKDFKVGPDLKVAYNLTQDCFQNITLSVQPILGYFTSYKWYDEDMNLLGTANPYTGHVETAGDHTFSLEATDNHGCTVFYSATDSILQGITASMFQIPNVITPNGDGKNDFILMPLMDNDCVEYKVLILNRWGNLVYEATKANPVFKGEDMKGNTLTDGVYFYKITSNDIDCDSEDYKPICYGFITIVSKK